MGSMDSLKNRIMFVLPSDYEEKIKLYYDKENKIVVQFDLHNLRRKDAYRAVNNVINIVRQPFSLDLIHGYNHGTVLKSMIWNDLSNPRIKDCKEAPYNQGRTFLMIA